MQKKQSQAERGDNYVPFYEKRGKRKRLFSDPSGSRSGVNHFSWKAEENFLYVGYIRAMKEVMGSVGSRKEVQIYKRMSKLISTRSIDQIKSHHQKMMLKYETLQQIIASLEIPRQQATQTLTSISLEELQIRLETFLQQEIPYVREILNAKSERDRRRERKELQFDLRKNETMGEAVVKIEQASDFFYITQA